MSSFHGSNFAAADEAAAAARRRRDDAQEAVRRRPTPRTRKALQDAQLLFRAAVAKSTAGQQRLMMEGLKRAAADNWRIENESLDGWSARVDGRDASGKLVGCYLDPEGREYRDRDAVLAQLEHLRDRREGVVFIASADAGPREGYVFTRGYLGRGYYDADWPRAAAEAAPDCDHGLWSRLSPHFFSETSHCEYNSGRMFAYRTSFRPVEERSGGGRKFREIRDNEFLSKIVDDCPEPLRRALVEANAEEPLEVLGCGYDEGSKGWDEHNGEVFLINRRFVFEREAKQCGV